MCAYQNVVARANVTSIHCLLMASALIPTIGVHWWYPRNNDDAQFTKSRASNPAQHSQSTQDLVCPRFPYSELDAASEQFPFIDIKLADKLFNPFRPVSLPNLEILLQYEAEHRGSSRLKIEAPLPDCVYRARWPLRRGSTPRLCLTVSARRKVIPLARSLLP